MPTEAQNRFFESEEGYRLLFESNPQPMWIYDRDTLQFLEVNETAIAHYGYLREEFLAMTIKDIRPPEDILWLLEKVSQVTPGMNSASARHLKKDGTLIQVEIVSHTLHFDGRRAELVLSMDVSEEKRARISVKELDGREAGAGEQQSFEDDQLTDAEKRVAIRVARGFSNRQIARELGVSARTVENHISHIFAKRSFSNRVELARYVFERERSIRGSPSYS